MRRVCEGGRDEMIVALDSFLCDLAGLGTRSPSAFVKVTHLAKVPHSLSGCSRSSWPWKATPKATVPMIWRRRHSSQQRVAGTLRGDGWVTGGTGGGPRAAPRRVVLPWRRRDVGRPSRVGGGTLGTGPHRPWTYPPLSGSGTLCGRCLFP